MTVVFAAAHMICRHSLFFVFVLLKVKSVITDCYTDMHDSEVFIFSNIFYYYKFLSI